MKSFLKAAKREHWDAAGNWLFYTIAFGALPFWGLAMLLWLTAEAPFWEQFVKNAQLAVYAAGLLAASIPAMQKEVKDSPFKHPKWFLGATVLVIACAALVFGGVTIAPGRFAIVRLTTLSVILATLALALGFFTELVNDIRGDPNLWALSQQEVDKLGERVRRKIQGGPDA